jgi:uncharacterized protein YnzC (UPF0291/DUF896 family)
MDLNKILKIVLVVAVVVIAGSVFYRYVISIPSQERINNKAEQAKNEALKEAEDKSKTESLSTTPTETPEKLGESGGYIDRLQALLTLTKKMWQLDEDYADESISTTEKRLVYLNTLYGGTGRILPSTSYINQLLIADIDYTQKTQNLFKAYKQTAITRIKTIDEVYNDMDKHREETLTQDWLNQFQPITDAITNNYQEARATLQAMEEVDTDFYDNIALGDQKYATYFSSSPSPLYSSSFPSYNYEMQQQTEALQDIAKELRQINFDLKYNF